MPKSYSFIDCTEDKEDLSISLIDIDELKKLKVVYAKNNGPNRQQPYIDEFIFDINDISSNKLQEMLSKISSNDKKKYIIYSNLINDLIEDKEVNWFYESPNYSEWNGDKFITYNRSYKLPDDNFDPREELKMEKGEIISVDIEYMLSRFRGDRCL